MDYTPKRIREREGAGREGGEGGRGRGDTCLVKRKCLFRKLGRCLQKVELSAMDLMG
jgi:hypothetical protein